MSTSAEPHEQTERRALLAVGTDSYESQEFAALSEIRQALRVVVQTLSGMGFTPVSGSSGYQVNPALRALRDAVRKAASAAPVVVVYYTGHGVHPDQDHYYLVNKTSRPSDYAGTALPAAELLTQLTRRDGHGYPLADQPLVLVILDCCYSGSAGMEILGEALRGIGNPNMWVIASAGTLQYAQQGLFAKAFCEALERPAIGCSQRFIGLDSLVQAVNEANAGQAGQQARVFPPPTGSTGIPPFFLNRSFVPGLAGLTVGEQHWLSRLRGGPEETTAGSYVTGKQGRVLAAKHLVTWMTDPGPQRLAVVTGSPGTGKSTLLSLPVLLSQPARRENLLRAAVPGSLIQCTADLLPAGAPLVAVHARGLNTDQVASQIAQALGRDVGSASALLEDLEAKPSHGNRVVVVDAIDEATSPATLLSSLVIPLSRQVRVRVAVGARRHVLRDAAADLTIDLDTGQYQDPQALIDYIERLLVADQEPGVTTPYQRSPGAISSDETMQVAAAIARRATAREGGAESFLLARQFALSARGRAKSVDLTSPDWQEGLPDSIAEAFEEDLARLGGKRSLARSLLAALAWAKGPGLPWESIWVPVADEIARLNGHTGLSVTQKDVHWLLDKAGAYIVEDLGPGGRSVYRPFHDLLASYLRGEPTTEQRQADPAVTPAWERRRRRTENAIAQALRATVPIGPDGRPNWVVAHPYLRTYLAQHAAAAGTRVLGDLVMDVDFLAVADPITLTALLSTAAPGLPVTARAYRRVRPLLGDDPGDNVAHLLEAVRALSDTAAPAPSAGIPARYQTRLASVRRDDSVLTITSPTWGMPAVAFGTASEGRLLLASGYGNGSVRVWDPFTGAPVGEPLISHTSAVTSVAFGTAADGRLLLAAGGHDRAVRVWDPVTGTQVGGPLIPDVIEVNSMAFGTAADGRLLLAAGGRFPRVHVWDAVAGTPVAEPLISRHISINDWSNWVTTVAFGTTADGRLLLASASKYSPIEVWDPVTGTPVGEPLTGHTDMVRSVAFGIAPDGRLLLASASLDKTVRIWDPLTGTPVGDPLTEHNRGVAAGAIAFGTATDGRLLLAIASYDNKLQLWDPLTGSPVGETLSGHTSVVLSVAFGARASGQPLLASASHDGTVRVWDPATTNPADEADEIDTGHTNLVMSVAFGARADGHPLLASASYDGTVRVWDPATGFRVGHPLSGTTTESVISVALGAAPGGRLLLASASSKAVRVWDPVTGAQISGPLAGHPGDVQAVALGYTPDRRLLLACACYEHAVWLWDPVTGIRVRELLTGHINSVDSVAFGTTADGQLLLATASRDHTVRLWDPLTGSQVGDPLRGHTSGVKSVAFGTSADGQLLLATASSDESVRLWEPLTGTPVGEPLTGHTKAVNTVAFGTAPGGRLQLASSSYDKTVRVWDVATRATVFTLRRRSDVYAVALSGPLLALGDAEGVSVIEPDLNLP